MLASMPKLYGANEARAAEREERRLRGARRPVQLDVTITSVRGVEAPVAIRDISTYGCSIPPGADWLRMGAFVWLRAGGESAAVGIVRWIREEAIGIEFLRPLVPGGPGLACLIED